MLVRTPREVEGADRVITGDELHAALPEHEFVILALSLTPESHQMIGATEFGLMREDAWLVNVARGAHVDTDALVEALQTGQIAGAALDVFDPEPLPEGHPLWKMDNVVISPHSACPTAVALDLLTDRLEENVRRFIAGGPLVSEFSAPSG
jgi:D-3-phosphoglycerate dehydrogenase